MIIFRGKAKYLTFKMLLFNVVWGQGTREVEPLEAVDFILN